MSSSPENIEYSDPAATPLSRVAGVFGSPAPTFASIARRPGWVLPILISTALSIAATAAVLPRLDFDSAVRERLAARGVTMPEERVERIIETQKRFANIGYAWALVANLFIALVLATVFWVSFKAFGWDLGFRQSFGITSHALLPYIGTSMLLILFVTRLDLVNPADLSDLTHANLGFFVDRNANPVLHSLAASIDVFTFWVLALLVIGYAIAAKVARKKAAILIGSLWGLYVLGKAGWAAIFR
ncbi:MAG TPA: YIP1 family protein [Thermoanaerobaculia bacterium]|nr:YIP1 family protein [Thermoanaerobaculia bacterium]